MRNGSLLAAMIGGDPIIVDFMDKTEDIPRTDKLIAELDVIQNAACFWLDALNGTHLNIFKGFKDEKTLVKYFLTQAYRDNVTVFASKRTFCCICCINH